MASKYQKVDDVKKANPNLTWTEAAHKAGFEGLWTSAHGKAKPRTGDRKKQASVRTSKTGKLTKKNLDPEIKKWAARLDKAGKWPKGKSLEDFLKKEKTGETKLLKNIERLKSKGLDVDDGHFISLGNEQKTGHPLRSKGTHGSHSYSARVPERSGVNQSKQHLADIDPLEAKRGGVANSDLDRFAQYLTGDTGTVAKATTQDKQRMMQGENPDKIIAQRDATNQRFQGKAKRKKYNGENGENGDYKNGRSNGKKNGKVNGGVLGAASKTRTVDALTNIGVNAATGNYAGAAVGTGVLGMTAALQNTATQKALGGQIGKLISKRAGRTMMKAVPGLDIFLSGQESLNYLKQGKLDQAGIAALSGAIGWIPIVGDGLSASLDLSNTGIDKSRLQVPTGTSTKKPGKGTTRRPKLKIKANIHGEPFRGSTG